MSLPSPDPNARFTITHPDEIHIPREQLSPWRSSGNAAQLSRLDIEAAMAVDHSQDKRTWTGHQSSDSFWTDTAVEKSRSNSLEDYGRDSMDGKSAATSIRKLHTSHSTLSQMTAVNEKVPPVPALPTPAGPSLSRPQQYALIAVCCLAQFLNLGGMNQTVAPVMILADYFDIRDYGTLSWFSAAYSMSVGTFILPAGKKLKFT